MSENKTIRIHVLHCGTITVDKTVPDVRSDGRFDERVLSPDYEHMARLPGFSYLKANPAVRGKLRMDLAPMSRRVTLPVSAYLIEHQHGLLLLDTGWSRDISPDGVYDREAARRVLPWNVEAFYHPAVEKGMAVHEQLEAMGIKPEQLDLVLCSHLDADHTSGLKHVKNAKKLLIAEEDRWWSVRTVYSLRQPSRLWDEFTPDYFWYRGTGEGPLKWSCDYFGDETLKLVCVPGHTDGQFAAVIKNPHTGKFAVLANDAAYSVRGIDETVIPGYGINTVAMEKSIRYLKTLKDDPSCAAFFVNHDPELKPQTVEF